MLCVHIIKFMFKINFNGVSTYKFGFGLIWFALDSSIVDNTISSHQKKEQNHENNNQCTDTNDSDRSDQEVFLSLSKSFTLKRCRYFKHL